jgi:hypothetical protein
MQIDFERIVREELPQAERIAEWMKAHHPQGRIVDIGCGPGLYVNEMRVLGLDAIGVDNDKRLPDGLWFMRRDITDRMSDPPSGSTVLSLEVGEHLDEVFSRTYIDYISSTGASTVYFSAARPGQGGEGHINCQPKGFWLRLFSDFGFYFDPEATDEWLRYLRSGPHMGWLAHPELGNGMVIRRA